MLLDLFIPFHLRHPLEPLLIAAATSLPVLFAVMAVLAHAPGGRTGSLVRLGAGLVMGLSVYLSSMMLVTGWVGEGLTDVLLAPRNLRYLGLGLALACLVCTARSTAGRVFWGVVLGVSPALTTMVMVPPDVATPGYVLAAAATLAVGGTTMGVAMWIGFSPSHILRAGAALFASATFTITLSATPAIVGLPGTVWRISTGIITPWAATALCAITGSLVLAAVLEHRRLARAERRERTLTRSESRLTDLVRASFEGLVVHRAGVISDGNERFAAMVGTEPRGPLERFLRDAPMPEGSAPEERALEGKAPERGGGTPHETQLVRSDGTTLPVEVLSQPLADGRVVTAVRDLSERRRKEQEIARLARHDPLTGLLNRAAFRTAVEGALGDGTGALVAVDLDRFKPVNDTHGHGVGDRVLEALAARFRASLRDGDMVARLGGDEFALFLAGVGPERAERLAARVVAAAAEPIDLQRDGMPVRVRLGASAGYALAPEHGATFDELLGHADLALYRAKETGRARVCAFRPEQRQAARRRAALLHDLRDAVREGGIDVAYQEVVSVRSGEVVALEALARWTHPEHGVVPPATFVPLAEENGTIHALGRHVLTQACRTGRETGLRVSVNASVTEMEGPYAQTVRAALAEAGLPPERLEVEVGEAVLLPSHAAARATVGALDALGVGVVLDDFGTGHSALCALGRHPFRAIKLDRTFLAALDRDTAPDLMRAVVELARVQRLRVTAEGVESHRELALLTRAGLDEAQGYLFGRPGPAPVSRKVA